MAFVFPNKRTTLSSSLIKKLIFHILLGCVLFASCSTKENTANTRRWQAFVTRYNVYHNAKEAYVAGEEAQVGGMRDNFTERLPVFTVGNEKMRGLGKNNFDKTIEKCEKAIQLHSIKRKPLIKGNRKRTEKDKAFLAQKEYNPFLKNVWLLMGRAQFQQGDFTAAASTFAYLTRHYATQPDVVAEVRIWLARAYAELDWSYDAEDALSRLGNAPLSSRLERERDLTQATFLIRQERLAEALPFLQRAARREGNNFRQARLYFLLAQVYMQLQQFEPAYQALERCIAQNPPYEMAFHARIMQTEALTTPRSAASMVRRLRKMATQDKNKDYLDQVYYAIGNIELNRRDTLAALQAYEMGREKATQSGPEKGILLLRLGNLYWERQRFDKAQTCYTEAIGLLEKTSRDYNELTRRSKVLDALVPHTNVVFAQDSLLQLVAMPEEQRLAVVDQAIAHHKRVVAEEKRREAEAHAQEEGGNDRDTPSRNTERPMPRPQLPSTDRSWYFYNPQLVQQGKQSFQQQWGKRKNADDWRRSNRTVVANDDNKGFDYAADEAAQARIAAYRDSLAATGMDATALAQQVAMFTQTLEGGHAAAQAPDGEKPAGDDKVNDPMQREYYLAQLPFTPEAQEQAHAQIQEALFEAAVIEKDEIGDWELAKRTFTRLVRNYPFFARLNEAYYHLFLIAKRQGNTAEAQQYKTTLATQYPQYEMTTVVNDPDFERNTRWARELEDSLYAATYNAYRQGDIAVVMRNFERSTHTYPHGANRPKFMLVHALARLGIAPRDTLIAELKTLAANHPKSDVAEMAGMMVRGLQEGRPILAPTLTLDGLWQRREAEQQAQATVGEAAREFTKKRQTPFLFLIVYPQGIIDDDRLLFQLANFNFSTFLSRGLDLAKAKHGADVHFTVSGFQSFEEVHHYAQRLVAEAGVTEQLRKSQTYLISADNYKLIGSLQTLADYKAYYDKQFAPLKLKPYLPTDLEPAEGEQPRQIYEDELPDATPATPTTKENTPEGEPTQQDFEEFDLE